MVINFVEDRMVRYLQGKNRTMLYIAAEKVLQAYTMEVIDDLHDVYKKHLTLSVCEDEIYLAYDVLSKFELFDDATDNAHEFFVLSTIMLELAMGYRNRHTIKKFPLNEIYTEEEMEEKYKSAPIKVLKNRLSGIAYEFRVGNNDTIEDTGIRITAQQMPPVNLKTFYGGGAEFINTNGGNCVEVTLTFDYDSITEDKTKGLFVQAGFDPRLGLGHVPVAEDQGE